MRGEKIPSLIVNHDKVNIAMSAHADDIIRQGLLEEFSGWFIIDGIKYIYAANSRTAQGTRWKTELKLVRREWPIPVESSYPYIEDDVRKSEVATGIEIVVDTHGESGSVLQSIYDNTILSGDTSKLKSVTTDGLTTFMKTLWGLL